MRKNDIKLLLAKTIRNAVVTGKETGLKVEKIIETMNDKGINRNMIKATIRNGNAGFYFEDDLNGERKAEAIEKVCTWIDTNLPRATRK